MSACPQARETQAEIPSLADIWAQDAKHYLEILRELADSGTAIVRIVHQRVRMQADEPSHQSIMADLYSPFTTPPLLDPHNKFVLEARESIDVLTRAIRRSIMLAQKIVQTPVTPPAPAQRPQALLTKGTRDQIRREIEHALQRNDTNRDHERQDNDGSDAENVQPERPEQLDRPDPDDDLAARPIAHIIAEICRELGLGALLESIAKNRPPPQDKNLAADSAASIHARANGVRKKAEPPPSEPPPLPNLHQPGPSIPPTPCPRL